MKIFLYTTLFALLFLLLLVGSALLLKHGTILLGIIGISVLLGLTVAVICSLCENGDPRFWKYKEDKE